MLFSVLQKAGECTEGLSTVCVCVCVCACVCVCVCVCVCHQREIIEIREREIRTMRESGDYFTVIEVIDAGEVLECM